jgi:hypothetical protein
VSEPPSDKEDPQNSDAHRREYRYEDLVDVATKHTHGTGGWTTPWQQVHHTSRQTHDRRQDQWVHIHAPMYGQQRRDGNEECGRAVSVQGDEHGQSRRRQAEPDGVSSDNAD